MILEELERSEGKGADLGWQTTNRLKVLSGAGSPGGRDVEAPSPGLNGYDTSPAGNGSMRNGNGFGNRLAGMGATLGFRGKLEKSSSLLDPEIELSHNEPGLTRNEVRRSL